MPYDVGRKYSKLYSESTASRLPQISDFGGITTRFPLRSGGDSAAAIFLGSSEAVTPLVTVREKYAGGRAFRGSFYRSWCGGHVDRYRHQSKFLACGATPEYALLDTPNLKMRNLRLVTSEPK